VVAGLAFAIRLAPVHRPYPRRGSSPRESTQSTVGKGGVLLAFYAAGLAVRSSQALAFLARDRRVPLLPAALRAITAVSGVIPRRDGRLLFTNELAGSTPRRQAARQPRDRLLPER